MWGVENTGRCEGRRASLGEGRKSESDARRQGSSCDSRFRKHHWWWVEGPLGQSLLCQATSLLHHSSTHFVSITDLPSPLPFLTHGWRTL